MNNLIYLDNHEFPEYKTCSRQISKRLTRENPLLYIKSLGIKVQKVTPKQGNAYRTHRLNSNSKNLECKNSVFGTDGLVTGYYSVKEVLSKTLAINNPGSCTNA